MKKVFMFLYPIKEYMDYFSSFNQEDIFKILNETIKCRYRNNGYEMVFVTYPDKDLYGVNIALEDKVITTDITFERHITPLEDGSYIYPSEELIINALNNVDELIIGGFHATDCVKRVGECAINKGIDTLVDLDLTDLFIGLYKTDYFDITRYDPSRFKEYVLNKNGRFDQDLALRIFNRTYSSPVYGFNDTEFKKTK
jgi:hypothetical protein